MKLDLARKKLLTEELPEGIRAEPFKRRKLGAVDRR
jgi:hypothetical protein